jgi:hypothetical protein
VRASLLAHSGQLLCRPEWPEKMALQKERAECYRRAAPYLGIEEHLVPFGGRSLPAYLWIPRYVERPLVAIMAPGANSVTEELHRWVGHFVERGLATFRFDGPGQGELTPLLEGGLPLGWKHTTGLSALRSITLPETGTKQFVLERYHIATAAESQIVVL